jgi:hypothetical protein
MQRDSTPLDKLLENPRVWRGHNRAHASAGLASGYEALDRHLPGGGWPQSSLTEILVEQYGIGELRLLMPALAQLSAEDTSADFLEPGWIAWVAPPFQPCFGRPSRPWHRAPVPPYCCGLNHSTTRPAGVCSWPPKKGIAGLSHFVLRLFAAKLLLQLCVLSCNRVLRARVFLF